MLHRDCLVVCSVVQWGLVCCVAEGLEVGDIFDQPFANPTHISRVISMVPFSHRM